MKNKLLIFFIFILLSLGAYHIWNTHINYRFSPIVEGKVYKSALIPPEELESFLTKHKIQTVVNLLHPGLHDKLNPASQDNVDSEQKAIDKMNLKNKSTIEHINIASAQVPTKETLTKFFAVLDDKTKYPVLIHCYHGTGRAEMYSALYRIEYEGFTAEEARSKTRPVVDFLGYRSSFAKGKGKGDFLIDYKARKLGKESTLINLK